MNRSYLISIVPMYCYYKTSTSIVAYYTLHLLDATSYVRASD